MEGIFPAPNAAAGEGRIRKNIMLTIKIVWNEEKDIFDVAMLFKFLLKDDKRCGWKAGTRERFRRGFGLFD